MTFTPVDFLILLVVAGLCGAVGQLLAGSTRGGLLVAIALGFIGALFGLWMARSLELPEPFVVQIGEARFPVVWSIVGSALFVAIISLLTTRRIRD